ncbi:MAG: isoprenyl transferase [Flavobacteriales bacterium]|nr:isoprenyl transferase [Flavobacteriales bacterium]
MALPTNFNSSSVPEHIAIIMDGNGRWAKKNGKARIFGHKNGVASVRSVTEGAAEAGVKFLTLYAFSTENWNRPKAEVIALMHLLVTTIAGETKTLNKNNICLQAIGDLDSLPSNCQSELSKAIKKTSTNTGMTLVLALSYSSRWEILNAVNSLLIDVKSGKLEQENITEDDFKNYLCTKDIPDPELIIRTSGEHRISNFLLWQAAYSEFYFTDTLWPDFRKENLWEAITNFQNRERRFGKTSEQIK